MADYYIKINRHDSQISAGRYDDRLRVRIEVTEVGGTGMQREIFIVKRLTERDMAGVDHDLNIFQGVASPYDIASYPIGEPDQENHYPFFLTDDITLSYPSRKVMNDAMERVYADLAALPGLMESRAELALEEERCFPSPCPENDSESESP